MVLVLLPYRYARNAANKQHPGSVCGVRQTKTPTWEDVYKAYSTLRIIWVLRVHGIIHNHISYYNFMNWTIKQ